MLSDVLGLYAVRLKRFAAITLHIGDKGYVRPGPESDRWRLRISLHHGGDRIEPPGRFEGFDLAIRAWL
jgi:hypothetical protein